MGRKKKKKKCDVCLSREHVVHECQHVFEECPKGKACKYHYMSELCMKFQKINKKSHKISHYESMEHVMEKLDAFERELEDACEYLDDHKGRRRRSCSTKKGMRMLQKACAHLREKCEEKFESEESSDDEDEEWCYPVRGVLV